ncbi:MAG: DUF6316 family protein [Gammaproteobacteria bacterium]|nr:DUF6316 family protein [Gammaproteobacteria bacterium]
MSQSRRGEKRQVRFRSDRMFVVNNRWYFSTREGEEMGPYATREKAEAELVRYLSRIGALDGAAKTKHGPS